MESIHYLIIGGGIAGTTAAETIRQNDKKGTIAIVSDEPHRLYSRILLSKPNFFLEKIPFGQVWLKKESWYADNTITLLAGKSAVKLDSASKIVSLDDGSQLHYEKLLLAIGGHVQKLDIPGADKRGVSYLRTLDDAKGIIADTKKSKRAVVIGGGFVGFEMCEMLRLAQIEVTLVMRSAYYWEKFLDEASGRMVDKALQDGGVVIVRNAETSEITGSETVEGVTLKDGMFIPCEMVIVGIGLVCPFEWIKEGGVGVNRGILANEYLETSAPDIWTAGDIAEFNDCILGEKIQLGNWVNAQMQGKRAAFNMIGQKEPFRLVSFYTTQGFGLNLAVMGDVRTDEDRQVVRRGNPESKSYGRIIIKNGEVIGATLINRTQEMAPISKIIERDIKVSGKEEELADPEFNLSRLL